MTNIELRSSALPAPTARTVGGILVALTLGSFVLGFEHLLDDDSVSAAAVLAIAVTKVWFVTNYFMDIRSAPAWLVAVVNGWIIITGTTLIGMYLMS